MDCLLCTPKAHLLGEAEVARWSWELSQLPFKGFVILCAGPLKCMNGAQLPWNHTLSLQRRWHTWWEGTQQPGTYIGNVSKDNLSALMHSILVLSIQNFKNTSESVKVRLAKLWHRSVSRECQIICVHASRDGLRVGWMNYGNRVVVCITKEY